MSEIKSTTYYAGLMQSRAYRALKNFMTGYLENFELSMPQWALLGHLNDHPEGLRLSEISALLSVEAPFGTFLVKELESRGLVLRRIDPDDSRAKRVTVTGEGKKVVQKVESQLRIGMASFLGDIDLKELAIYIKVLEHIASKA